MIFIKSFAQLGFLTKLRSNEGGFLTQLIRGIYFSSPHIINYILNNYTNKKFEISFYIKE